MKRNLLLILSLVLSSLTFGQVIYSVESPAGIAGSYDLTFSTPVGGWGSPDLLIPTNAVLDTLAWAEDATAEDSLNCMTTVSDVNGKIAVLYRGSCEFGVKAKNAQDAGAVAVVIINNAAGGPVGMAPGVEGPNVTIPVVMIGDLDGQIMKDAMAAGAVEVFIGNKTGFYPNDLGFLPRATLVAPQNATPLAIAQDDNEFDVDLGAMVYNFGTNDQQNVVVNVTVDFNGSNVYDETSAMANIVSGDSLFVSMPTFSQTSYAAGKFDLTYTITSDSIDSYGFDNTSATNFHITEDLLSYARLDENNMPMSAGGFRPSTGADFTACIAYQNPNASRLGVKGMNFSAITSASSGVLLDGEPFEIQMFKWNDAFVDLNDAAAAVSDYELVSGYTEYIFGGDYQDSSVYAPISEPFVMEDNQRYMFCAVTTNEFVFFGYDSGSDYTQNVANDLQPLFPSISEAGAFLNGFGADAVPGFSVTTFPAAEAAIDEDATDININVYPNPVSDKLLVSLNNNEAKQFAMYDLSGKLVKSGDITGYPSVSVDVKDLDNGSYIVKVELENGKVKVTNVVVNH